MSSGWRDEQCKSSVCCDFKEGGGMGWITMEILKLRGLLGGVCEKGDDLCVPR